MGSGNSNQNTSNKIQSFLESLRASRSSDNNTPFGNRESSFNNPLKELQIKKEIEQRRIDLFHKARQQESNNVYSSKTKETNQRIEELSSKLKYLAKSVKRLNKNLETAAKNNILEANTYNESFLEHLNSRINLFQKNVNSTNTWLEIFNSRSKKKGFYQSMSKRGGSAYTQSNERVIATSVG